MAKIGEMWVTIRLGRTPEERQELERRGREEAERQGAKLATALREFGHSIEPVEFPRTIDGEWREP